MTNTTKLPPELIAYFDGICDANDAGPEERKAITLIVTTVFETMKEGMVAAILTEREACATDLDALAAHEDRNADTATDDATRTVASLVATAYRCAASTIRDRK